MTLLILPLCPSLGALNLEGAVELALKGNRELMEYELENRIGRWNLSAGLRAFFPELSAAFSSSDSVVTGGADARLRRWSFRARQLIFGGGRQLAAYRSARRELRIRDLKAADRRLDAAYRVVIAYVEVLKYREILEIRERYAALLKEQRELALLEREWGVLTAHELLEIGIRCREYDLEMRDIREAQRESRFALALLLNLNEGELPFLEGRLNMEYRGRTGGSVLHAPLSRRERDEEGQLVRILQERASACNRDILDLGMREWNARRDLRDARFCWLPRIEAEGEYSLSGSIRADEESSFSLGLNFIFDAPLFPTTLELQAGRSSPDERNRALSTETDLIQNLEKLHAPSAARSRLSLIRLEREELNRQIGFRVNSLVDSIILNRERLDIIGEKISLESEKLTIEESRMKQGELTRLDYVESEIRLAEYKTDRIERITELYADEKELERLCGELPSDRRSGIVLYPEGQE